MDLNSRRGQSTTTSELSEEQLEIIEYVNEKVNRFSLDKAQVAELIIAFAGVLIRGRKLERGFIKDAAVKRAVDGRLAIGDASRNKVKQAAQSYRHLSKENAAKLIAPVVNLDSGTVRRYLSELFPGNKWRP